MKSDFTWCCPHYTWICHSALSHQVGCSVLGWSQYRYTMQFKYVILFLPWPIFDIRALCPILTSLHIVHGNGKANDFKNDNSQQEQWSYRYHATGCCCGDGYPTLESVSYAVTAIGPCYTLIKKLENESVHQPKPKPPKGSPNNYVIFVHQILNDAMDVLHQKSITAWLAVSYSWSLQQLNLNGLPTFSRTR